MMVALLLENNQLLRAAGNITTVHAVSAASLKPGSNSPSLTDLWVNGFFFASLALSMSTALFSVLAKQWIQVSGLTCVSKPIDKNHRLTLRLFWVMLKPVLWSVNSVFKVF